MIGTPKIGDVHGKLTVVEVAPNCGGYSLVCKCECGESRTFPANVFYRKGNPKFSSCHINGCSGPKWTKHGHSVDSRVTPELATYFKIKERCYNPNENRYARYGGRGITMCDRWLESFDNFFSDMGTRPSSEHSIERKNNDGNYEPSNCKWATRKEQANNRSTSKFLICDGKTLTIKQWAEELGVPYMRLYSRWKDGWSTERILNEPRNRTGIC